MPIQKVWKVARVNVDGDAFVSYVRPAVLRLQYQLGETTKPKISGSKLFVFEDLDFALEFLSVSASQDLVILEGRADVLGRERFAPALRRPKAFMLSRFAGSPLLVHEVERFWSGPAFDSLQYFYDMSAPDGALLAEWFKPEAVVWRAKRP